MYEAVDWQIIADISIKDVQIGQGTVILCADQFSGIAHAINDMFHSEKKKELLILAMY